MEVINVRRHNKGIKEGIKYIHGIWGNEGNYNYYYDAIINSKEGQIPHFFY